MGYIGAGISRFNTADELTVTGDVTASGTVCPHETTQVMLLLLFYQREGLIQQGVAVVTLLKNDADDSVVCQQVQTHTIP